MEFLTKEVVFPLHKDPQLFSLHVFDVLFICFQGKSKGKNDSIFESIGIKTFIL